eukprot:3650093-Pyramimonas_sp.AAC.1
MTMTRRMGGGRKRRQEEAVGGGETRGAVSSKRRPHTTGWLGIRYVPAGSQHRSPRWVLQNSLPRSSRGVARLQ